jgi:hypothetical protein
MVFTPLSTFHSVSPDNPGIEQGGQGHIQPGKIEIVNLISTNGIKIPARGDQSLGKQTITFKSTTMCPNSVDNGIGIDQPCQFTQRLINNKMNPIIFSRGQRGNKPFGLHEIPEPGKLYNQ